MGSVVIPGLPANLPPIGRARIPATYQSAKAAITQCVRIDECQDWADKAEALASYARQAGDTELREMADRIQARAIRRCGELIREIAPKDTAGGDHRNGSVTMTRKRAAEDAGLSVRQKRTALRVANVPEGEFEEAVESASPPSITRLAEQGKKVSTAHLKGRDAEDFKISTAVQGELRRFFELIKNADPGAVCRGAYDRERHDMMMHADTALTWLHNLMLVLESDYGKDAERS